MRITKAAAAIFLLSLLSITILAWIESRNFIALKGPESVSAPKVSVGPSVPASGSPDRVGAAPTDAAVRPPAALQAGACPGNPNPLGVSRVVEIDTTGGPGFGREHSKIHDFLRDHEVVLTFDDGPWPGNTPAVLRALADQCTKATFFPIGKHAMWHPELLREVAAARHTIGSHTWSHKDLSRKSYRNVGLAQAEIEMGISAVRMVLGAPAAPFFRFPDLRQAPQMVTYLGERNIAVFSTDMDSLDFRLKNPEQVIRSVMTQLQHQGKGIVLLHDFQHATAQALPELLKRLAADRYRIVHVVPKEPVTTLARYDEIVAKELKLATVAGRPTSSMVRTVAH
jgi:peptidoglycan-N-acetylglucosamine deacetylase